jgi:hypothetical protein
LIGLRQSLVVYYQLEESLKMLAQFREAAKETIKAEVGILIK